jgi:hypothetical protein
MDASTPVYSGRRMPVAETGWAPTARARRRTALGWALLLLALQQVRPSAGTLSAAGQGPARRTLGLGISSGTAPPAHRPLMMSSTGVGVPPAQPTPTAQP